MEIKQIKELVAMMEKAGIKKLFIKEKTGFELELERHGEGGVASHISGPPYPFYAGTPMVLKEEHHGPRPQTKESEKPQPVKQEDGKCVTSPMVGTFYASPSPDDPVFVKVGDRVDENTVLCIIEAMKVMNEVKAGMSGTVAEVLVTNAHPVEFGTKLFRIL